MSFSLRLKACLLADSQLWFAGWVPMQPSLWSMLCNHKQSSGDYNTSGNQAAVWLDKVTAVDCKNMRLPIALMELLTTP